MFTNENTTGYTAEQLDRFNTELEKRLAGTETHTDRWHEIQKQFADEVARR